MRITVLLLALSLSAVGEESTQQKKDGQSSGQLNRVWSASIQSGFADTFQLTVGGMFGEGPAWQTRLTGTLSNALLPGDSLAVSGWNTHDMPSHRNDYSAYICYRVRILKLPKHSLVAGGGPERWVFQSIRTGSLDWLASYNATYVTTALKAPITVQTNGWTLVRSHFTKGTILHTQVWMDHPLWKTDTVRLTLRHGPQHTYSWNFFDLSGHRVVRYAGALVLASKHYSLEGGYRQQLGLQPGIPDNRFWSVLLTRSF